MPIGAPSRSPAILIAADAIAILVFVTVGLLSHQRGLSPTGYARDALPILGGWFAAAAVFHPYSTQRISRFAATLAVGVTAGVLVRALLLGRALNGKEAAFLGVALVTILIFSAGLRVALVLAMRPARRVHRAAP
jgi:Protein of unknown function (DUF3054)